MTNSKLELQKFVLAQDNGGRAYGRHRALTTTVKRPGLSY
jgi:hypothetical protein